MMRLANYLLRLLENLISTIIAIENNKVDGNDSYMIKILSKIQSILQPKLQYNYNLQYNHIFTLISKTTGSFKILTPKKIKLNNNKIVSSSTDRLEPILFSKIQEKIIKEVKNWIKPKLI